MRPFSLTHTHHDHITSQQGGTTTAGGESDTFHRANAIILVSMLSQCTHTHTHAQARMHAHTHRVHGCIFNQILIVVSISAR